MSLISPEVVAKYARDAAQGVDGVSGVVDGVRKGVRVEDGAIELHLAFEWGASIPAVGAVVQREVAEYLVRMTDVRPTAVNVIADGIDGAD